MLSSKFLVVSFLYLSYAAGFVAAIPRGGDQFCESVRTVTVMQTVTQGQPPSSSSPPNNANPPPAVVTQNPGNVNLGNGDNNKNGNNNPGTVSNKNQDGRNGKNGKPSSTSLPPVSSPATTPPGKTDVVNSNNNNNNSGNNNSGNNNSNNGDPSTTPTLDPSVIQNIDGKAQGDGQTDSLVSSNNFINYCVGKTLTDGQQVKTGSCNPTPMGDIPSVDNMPSAKFQSPKNFDTVPANTPFTISLQVNNLATGTFTNAANTYFAAPQQLVGGLVKGHSHITVQQMQSLDSTQPLDPKVFAFFKGLNEVANNGVLTATVTNGLPAGVYRISSINAANNHQEAVGPVAQHGSFNDVVYITVADGQQNANSVSSSSIPPVDSTSSASLPTGVPSDVPSSSVPSPAVSATPSPSGGNNNGEKDPKVPPADSLPPSTSGSLDVSSTASLPAPTGGNGKNDSGKDSLDSPAPPSTGDNSDNNNDKGGNPTSTFVPDSPAPSSAVPPDSNPSGDKGPQGGNGPNSKRMYRRSRLD